MTYHEYKTGNVITYGWKIGGRWFLGPFGKEIRKCDYTPSRSTLLTAIASVKGGAA